MFKLWVGGEVCAQAQPISSCSCPALSAVSTLLTLLPPPVLKCRQFTVAGKHLTVLKGEPIGGQGLG